MMMERSGYHEAGSRETWTALITDPAELGAVSDEWRALAVAQGNAFLTPEWYLAWLHHYGSDAEPAVVIARRANGSLRGVLPLASTGSRPGGALRFGGSNLGDAFSPLADPADEAAVAMAAGSVLADHPGWRSIVLDNARDGDWCERLSGATGRRLTPTRVRSQPLPYIDLAPAGSSWERFLAGLSRNLRSQIGRKARGLERDHEVSFRASSTPAEAERDIGTLFDLHDSRWAERGGSASSTPRSRRFHAEFAAAAAARGWLRLWILEVDGAPVAGWYGWRLGPTYSYYLAGFDPRWADRSVGFVLLSRTIREAIEEGAREYDMLLGAESYKDRFATGRRTVSTIVVAPPLSSARLLAACEATGSRAARRLPARIGGRIRSAGRRMPTTPTARPR